MWQIIVRFITFKLCIANCTMQFLKFFAQEISLWRARKAIFLSENKNLGIVIVPLRNKSKKIKLQPSFFSFPNVVRIIKVAHKNNALWEKKFHLQLNFARFLNFLSSELRCDRQVCETLILVVINCATEKELSKNVFQCPEFGRERKNSFLWIVILSF